MQLTLLREAKEVLEGGTGHLCLSAAVSVPGVAMPSLVSSATWGQLLPALSRPGERHVSAVTGNCPVPHKLLDSGRRRCCVHAGEEWLGKIMSVGFFPFFFLVNFTSRDFSSLLAGLILKHSHLSQPWQNIS